jgi:hypothetical protein
MNCPINHCMWKREFSTDKCGDGKKYPYCIAWDYAKDGVKWNKGTKHFEVPDNRTRPKNKRLKLKSNRLNLKSN